MFTIPCWAASGGNLAAASDEQLLGSASKRALHTFTVRAFYSDCTVFSAIFLVSSFHQNQDSQLTMLIVFYISFLERSRVCGITSLESLLQTAGVRCRVLDKLWIVQLKVDIVLLSVVSYV